MSGHYNLYLVVINTKFEFENILNHSRQHTWTLEERKMEKIPQAPF